MTRFDEWWSQNLGTRLRCTQFEQVFSSVSVDNLPSVMEDWIQMAFDAGYHKGHADSYNTYNPDEE